MLIVPLLPSTTPVIPAGSDVWGTAMFLVGIGVLVSVCGLLLVRRMLQRVYQLGVAFDHEVLLVTVPKEAGEGEGKDMQERVRREISVAESLFAALGGMKAEGGFRAFFLGRRDHLSFEIVAWKGMISFYVVVPKRMRRYVEQSIEAQYPDAQIEEVGDYNMFVPHGHTAAAALVLKRPFLFPLKTYEQLESDPLNAITNALSRLGDSGAVIQLVVRSAKKGWHWYGKKIATEMHQGKSLDEALQKAHPNTLLRFVYGLSGFGAVAKKQTSGEKKEPEKPRQMTAMEQEMLKGIEQKTSKAGLDANLRVIVSSPAKDVAERYLGDIVNAFAQFNLYQYGNSLSVRRPRRLDRFVQSFIYRYFTSRERVLINTEEAASIFHFPLSTTETPNIRWLRAKKAAPPSALPDEGIIIGKNIYRGVETVVRMGEADRQRHLYVIGQTGTGKSGLIHELARQDIMAGKGVCVVDPHGSLVDGILECIPKSRAEDVIYFDPSDVARPIGLNMLEAQTPAEMDFVTQEMISIFYKLVSDPAMIGPMFEHNMRNAMFTLMHDRENPGTIAEIPRIFTDPEFQRYKVAKVTDPMVRQFWEKEMAKTSDFHKSEMLGYLISKVGRFVENSMMRNIIGQPASGWNFREVMDDGKILLVNLSKGKIGEINSNLLGLIIVSKLQMAAFARADQPSETLKDFYLYIDEFQNFITDSISTILSEARKYKLNLTMAHQYLGQIRQKQGQESAILDAVLGNVGTLVSFRIGVEDAETIAKQMAPVFSEYDLINVENRHGYIRMLSNNVVQRPFDFYTMPMTFGDRRRAELLKQYSRLKYGRDQRIVEAEILERSRLGNSAVATDTATGSRR